MKVILLAAGYATRLYPLTENFPKPLLEVKGKTILDWLIEDIEADEFIVISNHKFAHFFNDWKSSVPNKNISVVDDGTSTNETRLGALKDIQYAIKERNISDDVLIIAGDNLIDFSMNKYLDFIKEKNTSCVMTYYEEDENKLHGYGILELNDDLIKKIWENNVPIIIYELDCLTKNNIEDIFIGRENLIIVKNEKELQEILNFYNIYNYETLERNTK